jgi:hypothetical protein
MFALEETGVAVSVASGRGDPRRYYERTRMDKNFTEPQSIPSLASIEADMFRVCSILESVASQFSPESEESMAISDAALAYQTVQRNKRLKLSYDKMKSALTSGGDLTDEMKDKLRSYGIDPDELDEE